MDTLINVSYLLIVILVPIIPAYLLFKRLKSSAEASGTLTPIQALSIKVGGAFAGYFTVFALLYMKLPNKFIPDEQKIWEIRGDVIDANTRTKILSSKARLRVVLEPQTSVRGGSFTLYLPSFSVSGKEKLDYTLHIEDADDIYLSSNAFNLGEITEQHRKDRIIKVPDSVLMLNHRPKNADTASILSVREISY